MSKPLTCCLIIAVLTGIFVQSVYAGGFSRPVISDLSGCDFRICKISDDGEALFADAHTGDIVNDALHERNNAVRKDYGITISTVNTLDFDSLLTDALAGIETCDMLLLDIFDIVRAARYGLIAPLDGYIDISAPWWDEGVYVGGRLYGAASGYCASANADTETVYLNRAAFDEQTAYDTVMSDSFTAEWLFNTAKEYNNVPDGSDVIIGDRWGFLTSVTAAYDYIAKAPFSLDRDYSRNLPLDYRAELEMLNTLSDTINSSPPSLINNKRDIPTEKADTIVFELTSTAVKPSFELYAALPLPITDSDAGYISPISNKARYISLSDGTDIESAANIADALAYEAMIRVRPAMFDALLGKLSKRQSADDNIMAVRKNHEDMAELIFRSRFHK